MVALLSRYRREPVQDFEHSQSVSGAIRFQLGLDSVFFVILEGFVHHQILKAD